MFVDFGFAERYSGDCYLRFDDTNPEAEKQEYIDHIQDIVAWLGYKPWKVRALLANCTSSWLQAAKMQKVGRTWEGPDLLCIWRCR
jgi:glutamyl/glutaminyl-tRNA synthetase